MRDKKFTVVDLLRKNYNLEVTEENRKNSLNELGFDSLEVAELAFFIEDCLCYENFKNLNGTNLISILLNKETTLQNLIEIMEKAVKYSDNKCISLPTKLNVANGLKICIDKNLQNFYVTKNWSVNMGMCVDATPLIADE